MKVKCIKVDDRGNGNCGNNGHGGFCHGIAEQITLGEVYVVTSQTDEFYRIKNDLGERNAGYFKDRFEVIEP